MWIETYSVIYDCPVPTSRSDIFYILHISCNALVSNFKLKILFPYTLYKYKYQKINVHDVMFMLKNKL